MGLWRIYNLWNLLVRWALGFLLVLISVNAFADTVPDFLPPNEIFSNACIVSNTGVYEDGFEMIPVYEDIEYTCNSGYYLPANSEKCEVCPENSYCIGGTYTYNEHDPQGVTQCPDTLFSPSGATDITWCGKIMHIGDDVLYLASQRQTTPALVVLVGDTKYYAKLTPITDGVKPINSGTTRVLHMMHDGVEYVVHDNTVQ